MKKMLQGFIALSMLFQFVGFPIMAQEEEIIDDETIIEESDDEMNQEDTLDEDVDDNEIIQDDIIDEEDVLTEDVSQFNPYWKKEANGKWRYYISPYEYVKNTAYQCYDGIYYCFDANGYMLTNYWYNPSGNIWYYYGSDGKEATGWNKINNVWYYFKPDYGNQMAISESVAIDGYIYFFTDTGAWIEKGWYRMGSLWYYFDSPTQPHHGWLKYNGYWYYIHQGMMAYSVFVPGNGGMCFVDDNGRMVTNAWHLDSYGNWFYFKADGKQASGWNKINNKWYYFFPGDFCYMAQSTGLDINHEQYYFDDNGVWIEKGWFTMDGEWYYLDSFDTMHDGWLKSGYYWYYIYEGCMLYDDWRYDNGIYYYFDEAGHMVTNQWVQGSSGSWYYYGADGKEVSGWQKINNKWYYFIPDDDNAMAANCTLTLSGETYTFDSNGHWTKS